MKISTSNNRKQQQQQPRQQRSKTTKVKKSKQHNSIRQQSKRSFTNNVAPNPAPVKLQSKDVMKLFTSKRTKTKNAAASTLDMDTLETIYNPLDLHTFAPNLAKHYGVISRDASGKAKTSEEYLRRFSHTAGGYTEDDRTLAKYRSNSALFLTHQRTAQHYIASADMQYNMHNQKLLEAQGESPMSNISYQYANQQASSSGSKKRRRQARTMEEEEPLHIKVIRVALAAQDPSWMHQQRELAQYLKCQNLKTSLQQLFAELSMPSKSSRSSPSANNNNNSSTKHVATIPRNKNSDIKTKLTVPGVVEQQIFDNMKNIPLPTASFLDPQQNPDSATTQMYLTTPIDPITEEDPTQTKTNAPQQEKKADIKTKKTDNQSTIDKLENAPSVLNTPQQQLQQDIATPEQTSKPRK
eukprot:UN02069